MLKDKYKHFTIVHYGSWKCHPITRSVLGAEIYSFSHAMDFALALSFDLGKILSRKIKTIIYTDSKRLFDTISKLSTISEKRMLIFVAAIRQNYATGELTIIAHILYQYNISDAFTKENTDLTLLNKLIRIGT